MVLWYERTATGFSLVEVKKRDGLTNLAECPVFFPVKNCVEQHHLLIATIASCSLSCSYRLVVFDSHDPFPIALKNPVLSGALKRLVDPWLSPPDLEIRYEKSGSLAESEQGWADFLRQRFAFIHEEIRRSVKPQGFRLLNAPGQ